MFQFKQFTIHQDRTAMKVGTDGVLLGAWAPIAPDATRLLDIGTGTGLIALMLAQRIIEKNCPPELGGRTDERSKSRGKLAYTMPCKEEVGEARQSPEGVCNFQHPNPQIVAIDIDHNSIEQATENIQNSPFAQHITTHHTSLQDYMPDQKFDAIVCNPPYFVSSLKSPDAARTQARHTDTLSFDDLLHHSARLLRPDGSLSVVLPVNEGNQLIELAPKYGFTLTHLTEVHPTPTAPPKRLLLQFVMQNSQLNHSSLLISHSSLTIEIARHQYTDEYIALTRNFYLKM